MVLTIHPLQVRSVGYRCGASARSRLACNGSAGAGQQFANGIPDDMQANLAMLDELGGTKSYNHYPNVWAMAFNTPFKMWKRYKFSGGTADPCIIS